MCSSSRDDAVSPPLFEILHEDPSDAAWLKLRNFVGPFWNVATELVSEGYAAGARRMLEQKERVEDNLAARKRKALEHE